MSEQVLIEHPVLSKERGEPVQQVTTRKQFDSVWKASGWVEVGSEDLASVEEESSQDLEEGDYADSTDDPEED